MTKKRKIVATVLSTALLFSALSITVDRMNQKENENGKETGGLEVLPSAVNGISFIKSLNATNSKTCTLVYTLTPADADKEGFNCFLSWSPSDNANKENDTWLTDDKRPETYVTYTIDYDQKKIVFQNLEAFGYEMIFTMMSNTDSTARAQITINYVRKEISVPTYTLSNDTLENEKEIEIQYTESKWSVGTKGETGTDLPTYELEYYDKTGSGKTFADLIPVITRNDYYCFYREQIQYNGGSFTDNYETIHTQMAERSFAYVKSCISPTGVSRTKMDLATFKSTMSFEFQFKRSNEVVTQTASTPFTRFIENYASAYEAGSGLKLIISYKGVKQKETLINIKAGSYGVSSIDFVNGDGNIDF